MSDATPSFPSSSPPPPPPPRRRRRRWLWVVGLGLVCLAGLIAALPLELNTPPATRWLLARANEVLAPGGRLHVGRFRFSWFGPTRMTDFQIRDAHDRPLLTAPSAVWDRPLGRILFDRPRYGTLRLENFHLDITRRTEDGVIDLLEAIKPILAPDPRADWTLELVHGDLTLTADPLAQPLTAPSADIHIRRPAAPGPMSWDIRLGGASTDPPRELHLTGSQDPWKHGHDQPPDLRLSADGRNWPLDLRRPEGALAATWTGKVDLQSSGGLWATSGSSRLEPIRVVPENANPIELNHLEAGWDLQRTSGGWRVARLDLAGDAGIVHAHGETEGSGFRTRVAGDLDLTAALELLTADRPELPLELSLEGAHAGVDFELVRKAPEADGQTPPLGIDGKLTLRGLSRTRDASRTELDPIAVALRGEYAPGDDSLTLNDLDIDTQETHGHVQGRIDHLRGGRSARLEGSVEADWESLIESATGRLAQEIELEVGAVAFKAEGPLEGDPERILQDFALEVSSTLTQASAFGMRLGPTPVMLRLQNGSLQIDPIETTLNGGRLRLLPEITRNADWSEAMLRLAPGSGLDAAEVNDEVSRKVLAFVVPTLAEATRVNGFVSARFDRVEIPLAGPGQAIVEGNLLFDDVRFLPGPLANEILGMAAGPNGGGPILRLAQPVLLSVHDGRVYQHGLAVPLGKVARVEMEGWVDFDKNLHLDVSIPLAAERLAQRPVLAMIAAGVNPTIPIRGTLEEPRVDADALGRQMGRMGLDIANRAGLGFGAALLERVTRPRTPEEQARIEAEQARREAERQQRKALQQQKRLERRMRRGRG